ncbi:enoyl-CoA hydratase/isomerase family protein [Pontitalea aquivivens]|uniref:enoyl-CoA hydratase/isomerase family protein n=1 Tax=Pontitalea aquivivens TaxID=3388663 RepID=UPI003970672B
MTTLEGYRHITFSRQGRVLTATLNRPEALNAANAELHTELERLFPDLDADLESDVIVLTGAGRAFCAGGDLSWMQNAIDDPARFLVTIREAKRILTGQLGMSKPLIARVNGAAAGLGASLAVCCDVAIAADHAKLSDPHVVVGLVAGDGGALVWPQLAGFMRAREYLLTGDPIPAPEAARMGLITRAVPADALDADVNALAQRLAQGATQAIRWTKQTINLPLIALIQAHADTGLAWEALSQRLPAHSGAVARFADRR